MSKSFVIFVFVGGFAAVLNWLSRFAFSVVLPFEIAIVLAYLVGMTVAYFLNRSFVFEESGRSVQEEYVRFTIVNIVALVQVFLVTILLSRYILPTIGFEFFPDAVAHGVGVVSPVLTSYLGHKFFTFSAKPSSSVSKDD